MKTKLLIGSALVIAGVVGYSYYWKKRQKRMKANKKPDGMMNADGNDRQKRREQRREDRAQRRENARIMYEWYQRNQRRL